jgi:hypothetical protein
MTPLATEESACRRKIKTSHPRGIGIGHGYGVLSPFVTIQMESHEEAEPQKKLGKHFACLRF